MNLIVAVDKNWGIGYQNKLLISIPEDMKFFRETTTGKVVVMGRKTMESFPGGRPLRDRTNIVLTKKKNYDGKGATVVHSIEELEEVLKNYDTDDVYVIGGESVYKALIDQCDVAHITRIDYAYQADAHFPNIDQLPEWKAVGRSDERNHGDLEYYFYKYEKKSTN